MPRQGDGSSDNGPIEGHEIIHGATGDKTLQHTKHVAPMPKPEEGEALPGMNASGGGAGIPLNDEDTSSAPSTGATASTGSGERSGTRGPHQSASSQTQHSSSSKQSSSVHAGSQGTHKHSHGTTGEHSQHDLEAISREKAERYVNLDEEDVQHASSKSQSSSQRAPREVGDKHDVEKMHGKIGGGQQGQSKGHQQSQDKGHQAGHHDSEHHYEGEEFDEEARHKAEKFVNLEE